MYPAAPCAIYFEMYISSCARAGARALSWFGDMGARQSGALLMKMPGSVASRTLACVARFTKALQHMLFHCLIALSLMLPLKTAAVAAFVAAGALFPLEDRSRRRKRLS